MSSVCTAPIAYPPLLSQTFSRPPWSVQSLVPWWGQDDYNTALNAGCSLSWDPHAATPTLWAIRLLLRVCRHDVAQQRICTVEFRQCEGCAPGAEAPRVATGAPPPPQVEAGHEEVCMSAIVAAGPRQRALGGCRRVRVVTGAPPQPPTSQRECRCRRAGGTTRALIRGPIPPFTQQTAGRTTASLTSR